MAEIKISVIYNKNANDDYIALRGCKFLIKDYQRGYRWGEAQINALLDDIDEFNSNNGKEMYCLQPLVVKKLDNKNSGYSLSDISEKKEMESLSRTDIEGDNVWEVIDGQQRITTLLLIYARCIDNLRNKRELPYQIYYSLYRGIDRRFIEMANKTIDNWFDKCKEYGDPDDKKTEIKNKIGNQVMFIWYEVNKDAKSEDIFNKLNIGKIPLTNAELFKALLLDDSRINDKNIVQLSKIAIEWDVLEQSLHDDEFWGFLSNDRYEEKTRIDFLLSLCAMQIKAGLEKTDKTIKAIKESDPLFSFLVITNYLKTVKKEEEIINRKREIWEKTVEIHNTLKSWYNNSEKYHYIGFLIASSADRAEKVINNLILLSNKKSKSETDEIIKEEVRKKLKDIDVDNLDYEMSGDKKKIKTVLLYFNIATMIESKTNSRFSFRQFKEYKKDKNYTENQSSKETTWQIEHIHARKNDSEIRKLTDEKSRIGVLKDLIAEIIQLKKYDQKIVDEINNYISTNIKDGSDAFLAFYQKITSEYGEFDEHGLGNLTLLDSETNESYHNSLFPIKRQKIIERARGEVFIPICTKNVFLKLYSSDLDNNTMGKWTEQDAQDYLNAIKEMLKRVVV